MLLTACSSCSIARSFGRLLSTRSFATATARPPRLPRPSRPPRAPRPPRPPRNGAGVDAGIFATPTVVAAASPIHVSDSAATLGPGDRRLLLDACSLLYAHEPAVAAVRALHGVSKQAYVESVARFRKRIDDGGVGGAGDGDFAALLTAAASAVLACPGGGMAALVRASMPYLLRHVAAAGGGDAPSASDLRRPDSWYPLARSMRRRVVYHAGPTNSGKTFNALKALREAWTGVYCGPLRLLALEVYESLNRDGDGGAHGTACSLFTGQERRELPFAGHVACTIEMLSMERAVDVAVIDEIQMIGDDARGASWTRALLGVPAAEVHVCGDAAALPAVTAMCAITGDTLEVRRYERMTSISPQLESLDGDYARVQEGDAVVAFSRKDIYAIRRAIERKTAHKCCVVYGSLPPETRSAQARLFNDPSSGYRVLVASDAIGMGLNLNIRRVVFHAMTKFNGTTTGPLTTSAVKQIAGRAGRRSSIYPEGFATTFEEEDLRALHEGLASPSPAIPCGGLFPDAEQLLAFSAQLPLGTPLADVIAQFMTSSQLEGPYFMCRGEEMQATAALLQRYDSALTTEKRALLCMLPTNFRNVELRNYFFAFMDQYVAGGGGGGGGGGPVRLDVQLPLDDPSYYVRELEALEAKAQALDTYLWLASKLGPSFVDVPEAVAKRALVSTMLETALSKLSDDAKDTFEATARRRTRAAANAAAVNGGASRLRQVFGRPTSAAVFSTTQRTQ